MDQQEEFEILKEKVLNKYADYMNVIRNTSFDDLDVINTRVSLLDSYTASVKSNIAYRDFLNKYKSLKLMDDRHS